MPELPEVETIARTLAARIVGVRIDGVEASARALRRRPLDRPRLVRAARGARVVAVRRRAKYLLLELDSGWTLLVHLGMSGRLVHVAPLAPPAPPHTHVVLALEGGGAVRYVDARRFGVFRAYPTARLGRAAELSPLGPEPLAAAFTAAVLRTALRATRRSVKAALLDQRVVAGLGNIYVCEALFTAGIEPRARADRLSGARIGGLHRAIVDGLERAIANRGTTLRDYADAAGRAGGNQHALAVYDREGRPCPRCTTSVRRVTLGGRGTFFCPTCQRR